MEVIYPNDKDINKKDYYIAIQISQLIRSRFQSLPNDDSKESLSIYMELHKTFMNCSKKLFPVFSNNLANTNFNLISVSYMKLYRASTVRSENFKLIFQIIMSFNWNCTDSSEKFGKTLVNTPDFKSALTSIFLNTSYSENESIVQSCLSIISNIIRRESLKKSFDEFKLEATVVKIHNSPRITRDFKIICVAVLFNLARDKVKLKEYSHMVDAIRSDIILILDGASNDPDFHSEGFTMKELIEMLILFCGDETMKKFAANDTTLFATLLRILGRDHQVEFIIKFAKLIYNENKFADFRRTYVDKYGRDNDKVMNCL